MYEILAPGIVLFSNIFDRDYVNFIEDNISEYFKLKINNPNGDIVRKSYSIQLSDIEKNNENAKFLYNDFQNKLQDCINLYKSIYDISNMVFEYDNENNSIVTLLKYEIENSVIFHSDTLGMDNRVGAALAYLNDDYDGGELEFKHFNIKITPPKNSLIIFPSNWPYTHRSNPIVSGKKYALRCFLVSK